MPLPPGKLIYPSDHHHPPPLEKNLDPLMTRWRSTVIKARRKGHDEQRGTLSLFEILKHDQ